MKRKAHKQSPSRFTVVIDKTLLALARSAVHQTKGLTLARLIDAGLRREIRRLERQRARRFRPTQVRLPAGRPRKLAVARRKRS
ncbi:hypothetical protein [Petrachloros mirabilis]